ncbi:MAG: steroid 5-alpha reductase family enzyme [Gammaproteobacteria bacterium]|jgi:steroid 5-alpha reductase family enzyme
MQKDSMSGLLLTLLVTLLGVGFAFAGSGGAPFSSGVHPFALAIAIAFAIQWVAFVPAFVHRTEMYFDLIGSSTFITVAVVTYLYSANFDLYATVALVLVLVWAGRLGTFLFQRIRKAGKDSRFDEIKQSFSQFLMAWSLQALWVTFTASGALVAIASLSRPEFSVVALLGLVVWVVGFFIEVTADRQKRQFNADPENDGRFVNVGLWRISRHPNYFGEIALWTGVAVFAIPAMEGLQYWVLLSPVLIASQLIWISGIPALEKRADEKWGGDEAYERYKQQTPILVPYLW